LQIAILFGNPNKQQKNKRKDRLWIASQIWATWQGLTSCASSRQHKIILKL